MSTNLEYIERETSKAQRDQKKSERARARDKKQGRHFCWKNMQITYILSRASLLALAKSIYYMIVVLTANFQGA